MSRAARQPADHPSSHPGAASPRTGRGLSPSSAATVAEPGLISVRSRCAATASPCAWPAPVALVVGTILSAVNQGAVVLDGHAGWMTWLRVAVNHAAPFVVASVGYLGAGRVVKRPVAAAGRWCRCGVGWRAARLVCPASVRGWRRVLRGVRPSALCRARPGRSYAAWGKAGGRWSRKRR